MLNILSISFEDIREAIKAGYPVTVIINGEYYDLEADNNMEV